MPRSSTTSLSQETINELENQFFNFLDSLSYDEKKQFFNEFLTTEEKMMMYKRLALYWCLLEGYPLAKIQQMIGVTHDTTRVYNKKKNMLSSEFKNLIKRIVPQASQVPQEQQAMQQVEEQATEQPQETTQQPEEHVQQEVHEEIAQAEEVIEVNQTSEAPEEKPQMEMESQNIWNDTSDQPAEQTNQEPTTSQEFSEERPSDETQVEVTQSEPEIVDPMDTPRQEEQQDTTLQPEEHENQHHESVMPTGTSSFEPDTSSDENQEDEGKEKKKGWGKFFGF